MTALDERLVESVNCMAVFAGDSKWINGLLFAGEIGDHLAGNSGRVPR